MALFADVIQLVKAGQAAFHTQLSSLELQKRWWAGPAGVRPRSCAQLTGLVTFLTVVSFSVISEGKHNTVSINMASHAVFS